MPTPIFVCGAECAVPAIGTAQPAGSLRHWEAFTANVTIDTTIVRGNGSVRSFKFNPAASTARIRSLFAAAVGSPATLVWRFAVYFSTLPNQIAIISHGVGAASSLGIRYNPTGTKLEAFAGPTPTVAGSFTVTTGQWYVIDVKAVLDTTETVDWRVDGVAQTQLSVGGLVAATGTGVSFGEPTTAFTGTFYIDDIAVSGTSGDYPLGDGRVVGLWPRADGTHSFTLNDFVDETGAAIATSSTTAWTHLKNPLSNVVTGVEVRQAVIRSTGYLEFLFDALPANVGTTINGVAVVSQHYAEGTGADTQSMRLEDGATESAILALVDFSDTSSDYNYKMYATAPSTSAAWTVALVNALKIRWGYSTDVIAVPDLGGVMFEVDYFPVSFAQRIFVEPSQAVHRAGRW